MPHGRSIPSWRAQAHHPRLQVAEPQIMTLKYPHTTASNLIIFPESFK
jgi:hypothetical protein